MPPPRLTEPSPPASRSIDLTKFDAVLFDLDGVLTKTAAVHAAAWKRLFDDYLQTRASRDHTAFRPFDIKLDYQRYVDGKLRYDGVKSFLDSRGIELPYGQPQDGPDQETVHGLGNKKDTYFQAHLQEHGVEVYDDAVRFLRAVRAHGCGRIRKEGLVIPLNWYLALGAALFLLGMLGFFVKRNIISLLLSVEIMLNAVNLTFVAFSSRNGQISGQIFVFFVLVVAAAEAAVGLALIIAMFRNRETLNVDRSNLLKW